MQHIQKEKPIAGKSEPPPKEDKTKTLNEENLKYNRPMDYIQNVKLDLNPHNYPKKYHKFVPELVEVLENIKLANDLIDINVKTDHPNLVQNIENLKQIEKSLIL